MITTAWPQCSQQTGEGASGSALTPRRAPHLKQPDFCAVFCVMGVYYGSVPFNFSPLKDLSSLPV